MVPAGFHPTKQLRHLASDTLPTFFFPFLKMFSSFPRFFLRDALSWAIFLDTSSLSPSCSFCARLSGSPGELVQDHCRDRQGAARGMKLSRRDKLSCHRPSLPAGRRASHSTTGRQRHVACNLKEDWGQLSSLVPSGPPTVSPALTNQESADLSRMIKPSRGPLDLCLLQIMSLAGRACRRAVIRKGTS